MKKKKININDCFTMKLKVENSKISQFLKISGDQNPIHYDDEFCNKYDLFDKKIIPGVFIVSLFSNIIGNHMPGPGSILVKQNVDYLGPVFIDDEIKLSVIVDSIIFDKKIIKLKTECFNKSKIVVDGESYVKNNIFRI